MGLRLWRGGGGGGEVNKLLICKIFFLLVFVHKKRGWEMFVSSALLPSCEYYCHSSRGAVISFKDVLHLICILLL